MKQHTVTYYDGKTPGTHVAVCSCRHQSPAAPADAVEDWWLRHVRTVEQVRADLKRGRSNLTDQRDWYQQQADDPNNSTTDRRLWQIMADELDNRIGDSSVGDDHLF